MTMYAIIKKNDIFGLICQVGVDSPESGLVCSLSWGSCSVRADAELCSQSSAEMEGPDIPVVQGPFKSLCFPRHPPAHFLSSPGSGFQRRGRRVGCGSF